jgi:hypothetical protein
MGAMDWIRTNLEKNGRAWLHSNYEQCLYDTNSTMSSETYMRKIREVVSEKKPMANESHEVSTVEQLIDFADVDMTKQNIKSATVNVWGSVNNPNKQVKIELIPKKKELDVAALIEDFRKEVRDYKPVRSKVVREGEGELMYELSIPDSHFGLRAWGRETGDADYDVNIAREVYLNTVSTLLGYIEKQPLSKIMIITGSDFFNSDGMDNTTTRGTPQSEDGRFQKVFQTGWKTMRDAIDMCRNYADVEVIVIPGNHDHERSFYLGEVLDAWYEDDKHVIIDNEPTYFKYKQFGKSLLGVTHGDSVKPEALPLLMATDVPQMWAGTEYREWHTGHLHSSMTKGFFQEFERPGCKVVSVNSIAAASDWIAKMGYRSVREANGFLWSKTKGRIASFSAKV